MNKKILISFIVFAFIAGFSGAIFRAQGDGTLPARFTAQQSNAFQGLFDKYLKPFLPKPFLPESDKSAKKNAIQSDFLTSQAPSVPYSPTIDYEQAVIKAVQEASPAVVSIVISKDVPIIEQCPYNPFSDLPPEYQQLFGQKFQFYQPCEKGVKRQEVGGGSGFIISRDGLIVTNKHVVLDEKADYTVFTNDGKKYNAKILARDPVRDLAIIKISANNLPILTLGNSDSVKLGQTAIVIGNALGEFRNTVSVGVVSGLSRSITASAGDFAESIGGLIQTDAAINPGNSGGPLLNLKGEVVGINVATVSGAQSIGFTIPINQVRKAIESVKKIGKISSPYLGVRYVLISPDLAKKEKLTVEYGALVRSDKSGPGVVLNSPADKTGIKANDIILEINNEKITTDNSLSLIIQKYNVGDLLSLKILRGGGEINLNLTLEERPKNL